MENSNNKPHREIRFGAIRGTVWRRTDAAGNERFGVTLTKRVRTKDGTWKSLTQYDPTDLPVLQVVIETLCREFMQSPANAQEVNHD